LPLLVGLGAFAGLFVVPLQVFMQSRPPENKKGRMIALMNLCSWIGILISAVLVIVIDLVQQALAWPKSTSFLFIAAIMLPVALFYRPKDEMLREAETT
ncbi:MAG: MFS transporter, partial [Planctomycetota bacterium]